MKAARFTGNHQIIIEDVQKPKRKPGEALIRVKACGVCGSEDQFLENGQESIPGHEISGEIVQVDSDSNFAAGDRVAVYLPYYCGICSYCKQGKTNLCQNRTGLVGITMDGGYAEYVSVAESVLIPLDDELTYEEGVLLLDTIGTTHHGLRRASAGEEDIAVVVGCGPIGLGAIFGLKAMGVKKVYAAEIVAERLEFASRLGAIPLDVSSDKLADLLALRESGGVPLIVDCVGTPEIVIENIRAVAAEGKILALGEYWQEWSFQPDEAFYLKDWQLIRSWYFPVNEIEENVRIMKYNKKILPELISHRFPLAELEQAYKLFFAGKTAKVIINS